jgi:putative pyruvate formate lyase activating enzyme
MKGQTRRQLIQSCFSLAVAGISSVVTSALTACGLREEADSERGRRNPRAVAPAAKIDPDFEPAYWALHRSGELKKRADGLWDVMKSCRLCPRECGANRLGGEKGFCQSTAQLEIAAFHLHFGEERPLVGRGGSGTIFLTNCGLRC